MQEWVDLKTVQWAYAHASGLSLSPVDFEKAFGFSTVTGPNGTVTRYYSETRKFYTDEDRQILLEFKSELHLTKFLLRWSCKSLA